MYSKIFHAEPTLPLLT